MFNVFRISLLCALCKLVGITSYAIFTEKFVVAVCDGDLLCRLLTNCL